MNAWVIFRRARAVLFSKCHPSPPLLTYPTVSGRSFSCFDLPHMGYPLRHLHIPRVATLFSGPECVSFDFERVLPLLTCEAEIIVVGLLSLYGCSAILLYLM